VLDKIDGMLYSSKRLYNAGLAIKARKFDEATAIYPRLRCRFIHPLKEVDESTILVKKSLESDYPRPLAVAFRPIHGFATAISKAFFRQSQMALTPPKGRDFPRLNLIIPCSSLQGDSFATGLPY